MIAEPAVFRFRSANRSTTSSILGCCRRTSTAQPVRLKERPMLERTVERMACRRALSELGVASMKLAAQGQRSWPDRMFLIPGGRALMIEFKAPGEMPRPDQLQCHDILRMLVYQVGVCDDAY